jgi:hypothetical protein
LFVLMLLQQLFPFKDGGCKKLYILLLLWHQLKKRRLCEECKSVTAVCCWCSTSTKGQKEHQQRREKFLPTATALRSAGHLENVQPELQPM